MNLYREIIFFSSGGVPNRRSLVRCVSPKVSPGLSPAPIFPSAQLCCFFIVVAKTSKVILTLELWEAKDYRRDAAWLVCTTVLHQTRVTSSGARTSSSAAPHPQSPDFPLTRSKEGKSWGDHQCCLLPSDPPSFDWIWKSSCWCLLWVFLLLSACQAIRFGFLDVLGLEGAQTVWN